MKNKRIIRMLGLLLCFILLFVSFTVPVTTTASSFTKKGKLTNLGLTEQGFQINSGYMHYNKNKEPVLYSGTIVMGGKGCTFFSFNVKKKKIEKTFSIPNCEGIISMTADGDFVYFGTYNNAYLYRYNIKTEKLEKLADIKNETYVWDIKAYGNRVYASTFPRSRVYKYYVKEKTLEDLGSFSKEQYARSIEYYNNKIYAGIGSKAALIEYDTKTKTKKNILPSKYSDQSINYLKAVDSKLFIVLHPSYKVLSYDFKTKKFKEEMSTISNKYYDYYPEFNDNYITFSGVYGYIFHYNKTTGKLMCLQNNGGNRVCSGVVDKKYITSINQDGYYIENNLNGSNPNTIHLSTKGLKGGPAKPIYMYPYNNKIYFGGKMFSVFDVKSKKSTFKQAPGEVKSISVLNGSLFTGNYADAKIWKYKNFLKTDINSVDLTNESYFLHQIPKDYHQNRPSNMISNPKLGTVTVLSEPVPGKYGGVVTTYNEKTGKLYTKKDIVSKQYIRSIAINTSKPKIAYLGSSSFYSYGTKSLNENAHLVKYDLTTQSKLFDVVPETKNQRIDSVAYSNNKVYCVTMNGTLIALDANTGKTLKTLTKYYFREICASVDGNLYGITNRGFYKIEKNTLSLTCLNKNLSDPTRLNEDPVTGKIYFYDNLNLWSYE